MRLGVPVTIIAVMMKSNYLRLAEVARVAKQFGAPLRVNVYQSVRSDIYALTYEEYWEGFRALFAETDVIAIGEPLVRAMAGLPPLAGGCGVSTVRVTPRATTQPCVYWPGAGEPLSDLISMGAEILNSCTVRAGSDTSRSVRAVRVPRLLPWWMCWTAAAARRTTASLIFIARSFGGSAPRCRFVWPANRDLPKLSSSCTTVVIATVSRASCETARLKQPVFFIVLSPSYPNLSA